MGLKITGLVGSPAKYGSKYMKMTLISIFAVLMALFLSVVRVQAAGVRSEVWIDSAHRMPDHLAALDRDADSDSLHFFSTQPEEGEKASSVTDDSIRNRYATAGSWRWAIYTGAAFGIKRDGEQYNAHFAASFFFQDNLNISMEVGGLFFNQPSDANDTGGFNFNLLMRWHFIKHDNWTLYADAGAGLLIAGEEIPERGSNFNFTPQAGMGLSYRLNEHKDIWLLTGVRWHHISNANIIGSDQNPGRDSIMAYIGVDFPF